MHAAYTFWNTSYDASGCSNLVSKETKLVFNKVVSGVSFIYIWPINSNLSMGEGKESIQLEITKKDENKA